MKEYVLMNKDERLLKFKIESNLNEEVCVDAESYLPVRTIGVIDIDT